MLTVGVPNEGGGYHFDLIITAVENITATINMCSQNRHKTVLFGVLGPGKGPEFASFPSGHRGPFFRWPRWPSQYLPLGRMKVGMKVGDRVFATAR